MTLSPGLQYQISLLLENPKIECIGVVEPKILAQNILNFKEVLAAYRFKSSVHYVVKVNQSKALLRQALESQCRVDVSSYGELESAMESGYTGEYITANGPKNRRFLEKCIEANCTIAIDTISEIYWIIEISKKQNIQVKILSRISGFKDARPTRFGITKKDWTKSVQIFQEHKNILQIIGYSFHTDDRDINIRSSIFWESLEYYKLLLQARLHPKIINIGGGYGAQYHDSIGMLSGGSMQTQGHTRIYPKNTDFFGPHFLKKLLDLTQENTSSIGKFLEENDISLWIEPGRSALSKVGYVATQVIGERTGENDENFLILNTNSFAIGMREEELPTNPFLLGNICKKTREYLLLGNLCLESDRLYSRKISLSEEISIGSVLIFPDTAAYHMDFYATQSLLHPQKERYFLKEDTLTLDN